MDLVQFVQDEFVGKKDLPEFAAGDTITVSTRSPKVRKHVLSSSAVSFYSVEVQALLKPLLFVK